MPAEVDDTRAYFVLCRECEQSRRWNRSLSGLYDDRRDAEDEARAHDAQFHPRLEKEAEANG